MHWAPFSQSWKVRVTLHGRGVNLRGTLPQPLDDCARRAVGHAVSSSTPELEKGVLVITSFKVLRLKVQLVESQGLHLLEKQWQESHTILRALSVLAGAEHTSWLQDFKQQLRQPFLGDQSSRQQDQNTACIACVACVQASTAGFW